MYSEAWDEVNEFEDQKSENCCFIAIKEAIAIPNWHGQAQSIDFGTRNAWENVKSYFVNTVQFYILSK